MQLSDYRKKMTSFAAGVQQLESLAREQNMSNAANAAKKMKSRLADEVFHLVVVGEFSRGKSTFVNALLGRQILPASKNPTTAIISKIIYGKKPAFRLFYQDEKQPQTLSEEEFFKLTAPKEPDESDEASIQAYIEQQENLTRIDFAEIAYPLSFCQDQVEMVDTPGTNDLSAARIEITYQYLNHADAVILLLAATQPLTASEAAFLKERILGNQIEDIFFVISRKDELDDEEQEKSVIDFIEKNLREILPPEISLKNRIFLVASRAALFYHMQENGKEISAKQALEVPDDFGETGFPSFESVLGKFLSEEKGRVKLQKYNREAQDILRTIRHDLAVQIGIVSHSADEIRQKTAQMEPAFNLAKQRATRIANDLRLSLENAGADIGSKCHRAANNILKAAKNAVDQLSKDMPGTAKQEAIERAANAEKKKFIDATLREWQEIFDRENEKVAQSLRSIWNDIELEYQRNFQLPAVIAEDAGTLTITEEEPESTKSFADQAFDEAGKNLSKALSGHGGIVDRIGNAVSAFFLGGIGLISSFFGGDSQRESNAWRDKIRSDVVKAYSGKGEAMAQAFQMQYAARASAMCRGIEESVNSRVEDMEHQLSELLREKERQEKDAAEKQAYLTEKREEARRLSKELAELAR